MSKGRTARRKKNAAAPPPDDGMGEVLKGLTPARCPTACNVECCVITEKPYCGHPYMGAPQQADKDNLGILERVQAARRRLAGVQLIVRDA